MRSPAFLDRGCEPKSAGPASEYDARHRQFLPWRTIREPIRTRQETLHVSLPEADIARPRKNPVQSIYADCRNSVGSRLLGGRSDLDLRVPYPCLTANSRHRKLHGWSVRLRR